MHAVSLLLTVGLMSDTNYGEKTIQDEEQLKE